VIPVAIFVAAVLLFCIFFLDPLLTWGIELAGSKVNGAKVDVTGLKTKIFQGRLAIARVQVTDKEQPMKNTVDMGPLAFELSLGDLFSKRVIIPEAQMDGIKFGTERKKSGALPKLEKKIKKEEKNEKPSAVSKFAEKYKDQFKMNLAGYQAGVKEKITYDPKETTLYKKSDELKLKADTLPQEWKTKLASLNVDGRLQQVEGELQAVKNTPTSGPEALTAIPASLKKLQQAKDDLNKIKSDLKTSNEDLKKDLGGIKSGLKDLQSAKDKDLNDLLSRLNLDFANPKKVAEALIGSTIMSNVQKALHYIELARKYMPSKAEAESLPARPRFKGVDILFPTPAAPPRFWLRHASLSGAYSDIAAAGNITNLTTDPPRVGKPTVMDMNGEKDGQKFEANCVINHVAEPSNDGFSLVAKDLRVENLVSGGIFGNALKEGKGDVTMAFNLIGGQDLGGKILISLAQLKLDDVRLMEGFGLAPPSGNLSREESLKYDFVKNVARGIEGVPQVKIEAKITGKLQDPNMSFTSNLDDVLAKVIKDSVGNAVKDQRQKLEGELNKLLADRSGEINGKLTDLQSSLQKQLSGLDGNVQKKIEEATGVKLAPGGAVNPLKDLNIPALDKLFK